MGSKKQRYRRAVAVSLGATAVLATAAWRPASAAPSTPDGAETTVKDLGGGGLYNARHAEFVAKDLGGGGYWLATTTAESSVTNGAETGSNALLFANRQVLVPVERTTGL